MPCWQPRGLGKVLSRYWCNEGRSDTVERSTAAAEVREDHGESTAEVRWEDQGEKQCCP